MAKARTKHEKEVVKVAGKIPAISTYQIGKVMDNFASRGLDRRGFRNYFCLATTFRGFDVMRYAYIDYKVVSKPRFLEVIQVWIKDGHRAIMAKPINGMGNDCCDAFSHYADFQLMRWEAGTCSNYYRYRYYGTSREKRFMVVMDTHCTLLNRIGGSKLHESIDLRSCEYYVSESMAYGAIKTHPIYETLLKLGCHQLMRALLYSDKDINDWVVPIRIALRHNPQVLNNNHFATWIDHVTCLRELKMDLHNPRFVCSSDDPDYHAEITARAYARKRRLEDALARGRRRAENIRNGDLFRASYDDSLFERDHGKYLAFGFADGKFKFSTLQNIDEYREEGKAMQHCVYSMHYYDKPTSIIVSVKVDGIRYATLEVDVTNGKVKQCYGFKDQDLPESVDTKIRNEVESKFQEYLKAV